MSRDPADRRVLSGGADPIVRGSRARSRPSRTVIIAFVIASVVLSLTGCGVINDVRTITGALRTNRATIDAFTTKLSSAPATPFEATYVTSGAHPTMVIYAVDPPKELAFRETSPNGGMPSLELVVNASGEDACNPGSAAGTTWTCRKLPPASAAEQNKIFAFYTPSHWVAFLRGLGLVGALAGDKVTSSSMSMNGFSLTCVDFRARGVPGTSTICSTQQGILGYVKFAQTATTFALKSYSASPSASLFQLPAGAKFVAP